MSSFKIFSEAGKKIKIKIINAVLDQKEKYVRVADWDGKSLSFILADEICFGG